MDYLVVAVLSMHLQHVQAVVAHSDTHPIPFPVACMCGGIKGVLGQELLDVAGSIAGPQLLEQEYVLLAEVVDGAADVGVGRSFVNAGEETVSVVGDNAQLACPLAGALAARALGRCMVLMLLRPLARGESSHHAVDCVGHRVGHSDEDPSCCLQHGWLLAGTGVSCLLAS